MRQRWRCGSRPAEWPQPLRLSLPEYAPPAAVAQVVKDSSDESTGKLASQTRCGGTGFTLDGFGYPTSRRGLSANPGANGGRYDCLSIADSVGGDYIAGKHR